MPDDADALTERVNALEERLSHQDETIEALNQTITAQWTEIDALKRRLVQLIEQVEDAAGGQPPIDRPPPHY